MEIPELVRELAQRVDAVGGSAYLVGGSVRDGLLGRVPRDMDVEVHGVEEVRVLEILKGLGVVKEVGKAFGVYKLIGPDGDIDVSLPRRDSQRAERDPFLGEKEATRRRDLTVNAMLLNPLTGSIRDFFGGQEDLEKKVLREVDPDRFGDDPLRALRAVRQAATLGFELSDSLRYHCRQVDLSGVPPERVWMELERLLMEPECPGDGAYELHALGLVPSILPGLEGAGRRTVAEQLNRAADLKKHLQAPAKQRVLMLATLLSPLKRPAATRLLDRLRLFRWNGRPLRRPVLNMLDELHGPLPKSDTALRVASERVELALLMYTWEAVSPGGGALISLERARELGVASEALPELVRGEDLVALGLEEGRHLGAELAAVRQAQLDGLVKTRGEALKWIGDRNKEPTG